MNYKIVDDPKGSVMGISVSGELKYLVPSDEGLTAEEVADLIISSNDLVYEDKTEEQYKAELMEVLQ